MSIWFCIVFFIPITLSAQYGVKIGTIASSLFYPGDAPVLYDGFDVDLRPYLGYDAELAQTNSQKPLFSGYISVFRRFNLSDRLSINTEIAYSSKGVNFSDSEFEKIIYKVKIHYLEVPLSCSYRYFRGERSSGDFYLGAYGARKLNAVKEVAFRAGSTQKTALHSVKNYNWGVLGGTGIHYRLKDHYLLLDLRFFVGFNDLFTVPGDWTKMYYSTHKTKITGMNLSIGYEL